MNYTSICNDCNQTMNYFKPRYTGIDEEDDTVIINTDQSSVYMKDIDNKKLSTSQWKNFLLNGGNSEMTVCEAYLMISIQLMGLTQYNSSFITNLKSSILSCLIGMIVYNDHVNCFLSIKEIGCSDEELFEVLPNKKILQSISKSSSGALLTYIRDFFFQTYCKIKESCEPACSEEQYIKEVSECRANYLSTRSCKIVEDDLYDYDIEEDEVKGNVEEEDDVEDEEDEENEEYKKEEIESKEYKIYISQVNELYNKKYKYLKAKNNVLDYIMSNIIGGTDNLNDQFDLTKMIQEASVYEPNINNILLEDHYFIQFLIETHQDHLIQPILDSCDINYKHSCMNKVQFSCSYKDKYDRNRIEMLVQQGARLSDRFFKNYCLYRKDGLSIIQDVLTFVSYDFTTLKLKDKDFHKRNKNYNEEVYDFLVSQGASVYHH